ncbi:MAG TPA: amidohydrolase family protein [Geobacteraceae bacterium]
MQIFAASYLLPMAAPPLAGGAVAVADGRIVDAAPLTELKRRYSAPITNYPGCTIMPGLVNPHTHLELTHFSSWKLRKGIDYSPRTYVDWVIQVIKIRRGLAREELELSIREGVRISLEAGTTAVGEILSDRTLLPLYLGSPLGGRIFLELLGQDPERFEALLAGVEKSIASFPHASFLPGLSPHAPHTVSSRLMEEAVCLAQRRALPMAVHLAESREETTFFHDTSGKIAELLYPFADWEPYLPPPLRTTPTAHLDSLGVLGPATAVVHCVHVTPADVEILRERGVSAVICPRSNDRLDVGKAPVHLLRKARIPLALGTDSLASNDSLSLWDEMRFTLHEFPGEFSPDELLRMVTVGGARAIGRSSDLGSLEKGKRADFLVVRLPEKTTGVALAEALIDAGELEETFVGGRKVS